MIPRFHGQGQTCVLFREINSITVFRLWFLRRSHRIYFLTLSPRFIDDSVIQVLQEHGIEQLDWAKVRSSEIDYILDTTKRKVGSSLAREFSTRSRFFWAIISVFDPDIETKKKIQLALSDYFQKRLDGIVDLLIFSKNFSNAGKVVQLYVENDKFTRSVVSDYQNLCSRWMGVLPIGIKMYRYVSSAITQVIGRVVNKKKGNQDKKPERYAGSLKDAADHEIAFFPHKGVFYGEFYKKDFFYSKDERSPFHPCNILHLSLGEDRGMIQSSVEWYENAGIPYGDLSDFGGERKLGLLIAFFRVMLREIRHKKIRVFADLKLHDILITVACYLKISKYLREVGSLPNLRLGLIGYEILFPCFLSVALSLRGVRTVAIQDRLLAPRWYLHVVIVDYYLVYGPSTINFLRTNPEHCLVENAIPVGVVKADAHLLAKGKKRLNSRAGEKYNSRYLFLVLDYPAPVSRYVNAQVAANNWANLNKIYKDIVKLATKFPQAQFLIKGKDTTWCSLDVFQEVYEEIQKLPNMDIQLEISGGLSPEEIAASADAAIALYTSLGDELLATGTPVLFYDFFGMPTPVYNYNEYPVIVGRYAELEKRVKRMLMGEPFMSGEEWKGLYSEIYNDSHLGGVKARLDVELQKIYHDVKKQDASS